MTERFLNPDGSVWVPEFEGQRPPFQKGNRLSVGNRGPRTHGANSPAVYGPLAKSIRSELVKQPGLEYLTDASFRDLLYAYSTAEARCRLYAEWVDAQPFDVTGVSEKGTPPLEMLRELETRSANLATQLGLHPSMPEHVRVAVDAARTRVAARRLRVEDKKAFRAQLVRAFWMQEYPEDFDGEGNLRSAEDRLSDPSYWDDKRRSYEARRGGRKEWGSGFGGGE